MRKSKVSVMMFLVLLLVMLAVPAAMAAEEGSGPLFFQNLDYQKSAQIRAIIDDQQVVFDVPPQIVEGRILVPMRAIFQAFGLYLNWDSATGTASGANSQTNISFTIGSNKAIVNGEEKLLDVPATIIRGNTMIPLRFLSENMGYHVVWIKNSNLILLSQSDIVEWRYAGYETVEPYKIYEQRYINGVMTAETRYTGEQYTVKNYTLYAADGRLVPWVPEFKVAQYGAGWTLQSPYAGKTYWIDSDAIGGANGDSGFFNPDSFDDIDGDLLRQSAAAGDYLKVKIEEHYFSLEAWQEIIDAPDSLLSAFSDENLLDEEIIKGSDTLLKVTINDKYPAIISRDALLTPVLSPDPQQAYIVLTKDPKKTFNWSEDTWKRLKGDSPWIGMTKEMLLVQKQMNPDYTSKITTQFSVLEILVFEGEFGDSVFCFDDSILTSMW